MTRSHTRERTRRREQLEHQNWTSREWREEKRSSYNDLVWSRALRCTSCGDQLFLHVRHMHDNARFFLSFTYEHSTFARFPPLTRAVFVCLGYPQGNNRKYSLAPHRCAVCESVGESFFVFSTAADLCDRSHVRADLATQVESSTSDDDENHENESEKFYFLIKSHSTFRSKSTSNAVRFLERKRKTYQIPIFFSHSYLWVFTVKLHSLRSLYVLGSCLFATNELARRLSFPKSLHNGSPTNRRHCAMV